MKEIEDKLNKSVSLKEVSFRFFFLVNQFRNIGKFTTISLIIISFFQTFFILDFLIKYKNNNIPLQIVNSNISIIDILGIFMRFSLIMPILEIDKSILSTMHKVFLGLIYFYCISLFICIVYSVNCIIRNKEVYFSFVLSYISTLFQLIQWVLYQPTLYVLSYSFFGVYKDLTSPIVNNTVFATINIILMIFIIFLSFIITILNNDSINRLDNSLCRKDYDLEKLNFYVKTILFFTFIYSDSLSIFISNIFLTISCIIIFYLIFMQFIVKHYYDNFISKLFAALFLCYVEKMVDGLYNILVKNNSNDYNFSMIFCFFINFTIFNYIYEQMNSLILNQNVNFLKDIEEMTVYMDILDEIMNKSHYGDSEAQLMIAGYIIKHKANCNQVNCPLNFKELYHPLTNRIDSIPENIHEICKNEIVLIHIMKEIYIVLGNKFTGNGKYHFAYSNFLLFRMGNSKLALIEIQKSILFSKTIQQEYSFFLLKKIVNDFLLNNQFYINSNISNTDIIDVIIFDILAKKFEMFIEECSKLKISFWTTLQENKVFIEDLYKKGKNYIKMKKNVSKTWKEITEISKNNKRLFELYKNYLDCICDDLSGLSNELIYNDLDVEVDNIVESRFNDDTGFVIINLNFGINIGNINYINKSINKIFKYENDELIGKNISILQPQSMGKFHNKFLKNYIETGKIKQIGKNNLIYGKDKEKFLVPICLFIIPLPSFSSMSEILGLIRERYIEGSVIIVNEFGLIDCFSRDLLKYDERLDPVKELNGISFFIFYIFPELFYTNHHDNSKSKRPFFINEKKLLELTTLYGYFDLDLVKKLQELESDSRKRNPSRKDKIRRETSQKIDNYKINLKILFDFKRACLAIKEYVEKKNEEKLKLINIHSHISSKDRDKNNINNEINLTKISSLKKRDNFFVDHYDYFERYKNYLDNSIEMSLNDGKKRVFKKQFVVKIEPIKFRSQDKEAKIYIIHFRTPPSKNESFMGWEDQNDSFQEKEDFKFKKSKSINKLDDDTGSVSSSLNITHTSISSTVQRLREQNLKNNSFHKSHYMNLLLYFLVGILIGLITYYNIHINSFTNQQNIITKGIDNFYKMKVNLLYLRKYTFLKNLNLTLNSSSKSLLQNEFKSLNSRLIEISLNLLKLNENSTSILMNLTNKDYVNNLNQISFNYLDKFYMFSEILDMLILYSLFMCDSSLLTNPINNGNLSILISSKINLSLDLDNIMNFLVVNTNNQIHNVIMQKISVLYSLFNYEINRTLQELIVGYIIFSSLAFVIFILIFLILKERYNYNQTILEFLKQIKNDEIKEIVTKIEQFLKNINGSNKSNTTADYKALNQFTITNDNEIDKEKFIIREENIFLSFFLNIALIVILIAIHLLLNYYVTLSFINNFKSLSNYNEIIYNSQQYNILLISNLRDIYISNNTAMYNHDSLIISYLNLSIYNAKSSSDLIFYNYSEQQENFPSDTQIKLDLIFYTDVCSSIYFNITCDSDIYREIFYKGLRYSLNFYSYLINNVIFFFNPFNKIDLLSIFINNNQFFYLPSFLEEYKLSTIYENIILELNNKIYINSGSLCLMILIISLICISTILFSISISWKRYVNKIKLEEYMSNKIIAEIPIYIITNSKVIRQHLVEFSKLSK